MRGHKCHDESRRTQQSISQVLEATSQVLYSPMVYDKKWRV